MTHFSETVCQHTTTPLITAKAIKAQLSDKSTAFSNIFQHNYCHQLGFEVQQKLLKNPSAALIEFMMRPKVSRVTKKNNLSEQSLPSAFAHVCARAPFSPLLP